MEKNLVNLFLLIIGVLLVVGSAAYFLQANDAKNSTKLDGFADCLASKGAKFYGAFWCPHCQDQKKLFGTSKKYLPYVECSSPDSKVQLQVCADAKIQVYPTWQFANGAKQEGEMSLKELADKTGCALP